MRALDAALNAMWAMEETALERLALIASRQNDPTPEALEAYRAKALANTERAEVRDGVAILNVAGPLFKGANLFTMISGATSYDVLRRDFQSALDDPKVKGILFRVDSPGGEVTGTAELAAAIYAARGTKPIKAYVAGMGASAAYWLSAAVDPGGIVVDPTALLGSIGVQMGLKDDSEAEAKRGVKTYRFVSSQSPMKNAGPDTDEGAKAIQATVDAMAQVFVETVATYRGKDTETVLKDFGRGGIFVGKDAVKAGLADSLGDFESVLASLAGRKGAARGATRKQGISMSENANEPEGNAKPVDNSAAIAAAVTAALSGERTRIAGIDKIAASFGVDASVVAKAKEDGSTVEAFALAAADAASAKAAEAGKAAITALKNDEKTASKVESSDGNEPGEKTAEDLAKEIVAAASLAAGE